MLQRQARSAPQSAAILDGTRLHATHGDGAGRSAGLATIPALIAGSDYIATVRARLVRVLATPCLLELRPRLLPLPRMEQTAQWQNYRTQHPGLVWLRAPPALARREWIAIRNEPPGHGYGRRAAQFEHHCSPVEVPQRGRRPPAAAAATVASERQLTGIIDLDDRFQGDVPLRVEP